MNAQHVIARMEMGDLPTLASSYSFQSVFDDGAMVAHQVMQVLVSGGQISLADPRQRGARWRLTPSSE